MAQPNMTDATYTGAGSFYWPGAIRVLAAAKSADTGRCDD